MECSSLSLSTGDRGEPSSVVQIAHCSPGSRIRPLSSLIILFTCLRSPAVTLADAPSWTYIRHSTLASVVPFRHDEYPRFILGAYPFYASTFSVSAAFLVFCALWVGLGEERGKKKAE